MSKSIFFIFGLFYSALIGATIQQASKLRTIEWEKLSDKNQITVFTPVSFQHGSGLVPIKFKATMDHDVVKVLSALADNERKLEWLPNLEEVQVLEKASLNRVTVYYRYDAPWPFADRDFVVFNDGHYDAGTQTISVDFKSIEHQKDPKYGSSVRGTTYDGYCIIRPLANGKTELEMAFINDFGGMIPRFLINLVQKKWPYRFMSQLREQLAKKDLRILPEFKQVKEQGFR